MRRHTIRPLPVALLLAALAGGAAAQQTEAPTPSTTEAAQPQPRIEQAVLVRLVRSILVAVNNANLTGNYTVLRDLGSPSFTTSNSAADLSERFKPLRDSQVDLSPILLLPINLSRPPEIDSEGRLDVEGVVPMRPLLVSFRMRFEAVNSSWRLSDLAIGLNASVDPDQQASESDAEPEAPAEAEPEAQAQSNEDAQSETATATETAAPATPPAPSRPAPPRSIPLPTPKPEVGQ